MIFCGVALQLAAQDRDIVDGRTRIHNADASYAGDSGRTLNRDERLSLIAVAFDSRTRRRSERDCSHLVHTIYERAGFPYSYAPSADLYEGMQPFQRVKRPQPGDLIVWRGHVGIVTKPSEHLFYSFLRSGPGIDDYSAKYWRRLGHPRFYRYVKD